MNRETRSFGHLKQFAYNLSGLDTVPAKPDLPKTCRLEFRWTVEIKSFDIGVWYSSKPMDARESGEYYIGLCEETIRPRESSPAIAAFVQELAAKYPQLDDVPDDDIDGYPWNCAFDVSDGHVIMPMAYSRIEEIVPVIYELAEKHGLICYDPQSSHVMLPANLRV